MVPRSDRQIEGEREIDRHIVGLGIQIIFHWRNGLLNPESPNVKRPDTLNIPYP